MRRPSQQRGGAACCSRTTPRALLTPRPRVGQAVALEWEPENLYDPNAVAVRTLANQSLGYIAREQTVRFPQHLCFGHVRSVGQAATGAWGFQVCGWVGWFCAY